MEVQGHACHQRKENEHILHRINPELDLTHGEIFESRSEKLGLGMSDQHNISE